MDPPRRPGAFSALPPSSGTQPAPTHALRRRSRSSESDSSGSSQTTALSSTNQLQPQSQHGQVVPGLTALPNPAQSASLPSITQVTSDLPLRRPSPLDPRNDVRTHKRNNSQGFFEPSLPTASLTEQPAMPSLTASQIAAQAAMQHQQRSSSQHSRKRSQTVPSPQSPPDNGRIKSKPPPIPSTQLPSVRKLTGAPSGGGQAHNGSVKSPTLAAATAANAAFPRSAQLSPGLTSFSELHSDKEPRAKAEKSKMKLFSKPKHIGISTSKDVDRKDRPLPSPGKTPSPGPSMLSKAANTSTVSLIDPTVQGPRSLYSLANSSTSTLVPKSEDKEKVHRHHFLSRQKNKFRDKEEDHAVATSATSASRPVDASVPQSINSFAPPSPGPLQGTFSKSMSGFDLRHGGRALREKWREEKALALPDPRRQDADKHEWLPGAGPSSTAASNAWMIAGIYGGDSYGGPGLGVSNVAAEDAWELLKAKMLVVFEGEAVRATIEDLNRLVVVHLQRCIQRQSPTTIVEDVREYLLTGFLSLEHTLKGVPDDRLVPYLVEMWLFVFGSVLPYIQAVFLPLDLEFRGSGPLMSFAEAAEFWGFDPNTEPDGGDNALDMRRIVLLAFRDAIILPRHDALTTIFSRLTLESFDIGPDRAVPRGESVSLPRPGTAGSPGLASSSFNSQDSTLLGDGSAGGTAGGARSRTTSNTSAPELPPFTSALAAAPLAEGAGSTALPQRLHQVQVQVQRPADSARVTESVARMLQCMSVLVGLRSADASQKNMEGLAKALKLNWLGRGRTGRNRKGFVGARPGRAVRL